MRTWEALFIDAVVAGAMGWALLMCAAVLLARAAWHRLRDG